MKHEHPEPQGCPFDFKKPLTCPACIEIIKIKRAGLCRKYGWTKWPDDLKGGIE